MTRYRRIKARTRVSSIQTQCKDIACVGLAAPTPHPWCPPRGPTEDMENEGCAQSRPPGPAAAWEAGGDNTLWLILQSRESKGCEQSSYMASWAGVSELTLLLSPMPAQRSFILPGSSALPTKIPACLSTHFFTAPVTKGIAVLLVSRQGLRQGDLVCDAGLRSLTAWAKSGACFFPASDCRRAHLLTALNSCFRVYFVCLFLF